MGEIGDRQLITVFLLFATKNKSKYQDQENISAPHFLIEMFFSLHNIPFVMNILVYVYNQLPIFLPKSPLPPLLLLSNLLPAVLVPFLGDSSWSKSEVCFLEPLSSCTPYKDQMLGTLHGRAAQGCSSMHWEFSLGQMLPLSQDHLAAQLPYWLKLTIV